MPKKPNRALLEAWTNLQQVVSQINSEEPKPYLMAIKHWIENHERLLGSNFLHGYGALTLLLEGEVSEFPLQHPIQAINFLIALINSSVPINIQDAASILETIVCEFAVYTQMEDCPRCEEGYLGYWFSPSRGEFLLDCPECGWCQSISGSKWSHSVDDFRPATLQDLALLNL